MRTSKITTTRELSNRLSILFLLILLLFGVVAVSTVGYTLWLTIGNPSNGLQAQITSINNTVVQINNTISQINITQLLLIQETLSQLDASTIVQLILTVNNLVNNQTSLTERVVVLETNATNQQTQIDALLNVVTSLGTALAICNCSNSSTTTTELPWGAASPPIPMTVLNKITAASEGTCFGVSRPTGGFFWSVTGTCSFTFIQNDAAGQACSGQINVVPTFGAPLRMALEPGAQGSISFTNTRTAEVVVGTFFPDDVPDGPSTYFSIFVVSFTFSASSAVGDIWTSSVFNITP